MFAGQAMSEPIPAAGTMRVSHVPLGPESLAEVATTPFGVYVHVPFCAVRCGYCDFNTYTANELGSSPGASRESWHTAAITEVRRAARRLADSPGGIPAVDTVFFGGGTPTLLQPRALLDVLDAIDSEMGLTPDAEVTTEANPDSVDLASLGELRAGGFTRVSFGMQSAVPHVLAVLDRTHTPGRAASAVAEARDAGFEQVSLDLIYGSPGETLADWETSVRTALDSEPDHLSAYSLILEPGTRLARQVTRGMFDVPDEDEVADMYECADDLLVEAGMAWYELSNYSLSPASRCRHNINYWRGGNWWGIGPGAHSHVGGVRWSNVKHPAAWSGRLLAGESVASDVEVLDAHTRWVEDIMLRIRLVDGLPLALLGQRGPEVVADLEHRELVVTTSSRAILTRRGRLLADAIVRDLVDRCAPTA